MTDNARPPGWYPDATGTIRHWDGARWGETLAPGSPDGQPAIPSPGKKFLMPVFACLGLAVALVVIGAINGDSQDTRQASAFGVCQDFVKDQLRAPATAKFPRYGEGAVQALSNDRYAVRSTVDSQNGFGALVRNDFLCTVEYVGDERWNLLNLEIG